MAILPDKRKGSLHRRWDQEVPFKLLTDVKQEKNRGSVAGGFKWMNEDKNSQ